jgi:type VI secretion system secreted protein Hcp
MAAQVDYFLKIEGVDGESPDQNYPGWIQLDAWQWAEENAGHFSTGSGGGSGKVEMKDFEFRMLTNKASPKLFLMCAMGEHITQAKLVCRKSGLGQKDFLTITFGNCLVSSFKTVGNMPLTSMGLEASETILPTDVIKLNFARIEIEYKAQNNDGSMGATIKTGYDLKLNARI